MLFSNAKTLAYYNQVEKVAFRLLTLSSLDSLTS